MKPEQESLRLFGVTRAKGKMFELGLPEPQHLRVPESDEPASVLLLAVSILGDNAVDYIEEAAEPRIEQADLEFAASYFDALLASRFDQDITADVTLLAAAAYYHASRPGSSRVMAERLRSYVPESPVESLLHWILRGLDGEMSEVEGPNFELALLTADATRAHFAQGADAEAVLSAAAALRAAAYGSDSARDLLIADLVLSILKMKLAASAWLTLPAFSELAAGDWAGAIQSPRFPKELWPAQLAIGSAGLFGGRSGIVQMPTSAGKTRSLEIILRAGMLADRIRVAVVVAPFRALSHEIATSLRQAFAVEQNVRINELSDALQDDFVRRLDNMFGTPDTTDVVLNVLVLTPEKLQFVVRQRPDLVGLIDLLVYDEAHQFDSGVRGVTYELLMTEVRAGLPASTQVVAISAVIQNAADVASWLLGDGGVVVDGSGLSPTARAVAFATWIERRGQLQFFESSQFADPDYFVPRAIEQQALQLRRGERKPRTFPERDDDNVVADVTLYLGLRLVPEGAVAIYAGTKATAGKVAARAVEAFTRGLTFAPPADFSDPVELGRMELLVQMHFGMGSQQAQAARLGIFVHHRNTPNGLRIAIEHAMQEELIRFVICTSTLAQGVNLPIRYLIVTGTQQGRRSISVRDFQNLLGRAGRAGMHTEGLVIFADPRIFDQRVSEQWKYSRATSLLDPANAEDTGSSILSLLDPLEGSATLQTLTANDIVELLFESDEVRQQFAAISPETAYDLSDRRKRLSAIESYLMANRRTTTFEEFRDEAAQLAEQTFAYSIATDEQRVVLRVLFIRVAETVNAVVQEVGRQAIYGQTLLSVERADAVFRWVDQNRDALLLASTNEELLELLWPLLRATFATSTPGNMLPEDTPYRLARAWLRGDSYESIFASSREGGFTKPFGRSRRRALSEDDLFEFLNSTFAFDSSLVVAAVCQFVGEDLAGEYSALGMFLKSVKYGIPDALAISAYEAGFADRALAMLLSLELRRSGTPDGENIETAIEAFPDVAFAVVARMPSYFGVVLASILRTQTGS